MRALHAQHVRGRETAGGAQYAARALELPVALLGIYAPPASLSGL